MTTTPSIREARVRRVALPALQTRLIATRVDLLLVLPLILAPLNSDGALGFIATPTTKVLGGALALAGAVLLLLEHRSRPPVPLFWTLVVLLVGLLLTTSLLRELPVQRYLLIGQYLALLGSVLVWVSVRPQRVLGVLYTSSLIHLVLAVLFHTYVPWEDGGVRLGGGSHPLVLGFEASVVIIISLVALIRPGGGWRRPMFAVITGYAVYVLLQAFARQALISISIALVLLMFLLPGPWRWVRAYLAIALAASVFVWLGADGIAGLLGAERASDLASATGRTEIWARILQLLPEFAGFGYGYFALNDADGPDALVFFASHGAPAENALLQVTLDGGVAGAVVWLGVLVAGVVVVLRARGVSRIMGIAMLPLFLSSITVASGLAGEGVQWWWFLGVVTEAGVSAQVLRRPLVEPDL